MELKLEAVSMTIPADANLILGRAHFIKTAEDLYEALVNTVPGIQFGLAFSEASGPCLIRAEGNEPELRAAAVENARAIGAGHFFVVLVKNAFPINLLSRIREVPEVCEIVCASANPVQVIVARSAQGGGVLGVIDGSSPKGVEGPAEVEERRKLVRKFGYKL